MSARRLRLGILTALCVPACGLACSVAPASAEPLPDARIYELVTPAEGRDAEAYVPYNEITGDAAHGFGSEYPFQAASNGGAIAYVGSPSEGGNGNAGTGGGNEYLARRSTTGSWVQSDIMPGAGTAVFEAFSADLSVGILDAGQFESSPLTPEAPGGGYSVLYARDSGDGAYHPLFTNTPEHRTAAEFATYGREGDNAYLLFAGASADSTHLLFEANDTLTANAVDGGATENNLYDSVDGQLQLINVLPDGTSDPNATFGASSLIGPGYLPDFSHVISADGSRIFWTDLNTEDLYVREGDNGSSPTTALIAEQARFWAASADGSKVFFTKGGDLYRYELPAGTVSDLAPSGEVEGVVGTSEDGEYVYFLARRILTGAAVEGQPNLYLSHGGKTSFIATLLPKDLENLAPYSAEGPYGDLQPAIGNRMAEVSANGHSVGFVSKGSLTAYPNKARLEVYVYDADTEQLACASCDPSGAPPSLPGPAGYVPVGYGAVYQPRWLSADGSRVFFDSDGSLVPQDDNGLVDVYEWERDGSGSCHENGDSGGCLYLLSGGTSTDESFLLDASSNGEDVFVVTRAQLTPEDQYESFKVYDVHANGVPPLAPPVCSGTGCQGVPGSPPVFATPSSVTFGGVGNFPAPVVTTVKQRVKTLTRAQKLARALGACRKRGRRGRVACEVRARKAYGARSSAMRSASMTGGK